MITFGGYDLDKYATKNSSINWHTIHPKSPSWQVTMQDFTFVGHPEWIKNEFKGRDITIDSGTSYISIPEGDLDKYLRILEKNTGMKCGPA